MRDAASRALENLSLSSRFSRYLPLVIWMAFIALASTAELSAANTSRIIRPLTLWLFPNISPEQLLAVHVTVRKAMHFCEYFILGFLAARAFGSSSVSFLRQHWFKWATVLVVFYALLDEYHQSFVPSRTGSIYDSFIDTAGGVTALLIYGVWLRRRKAKESGLELSLS